MTCSPRTTTCSASGRGRNPHLRLASFNTDVLNYNGPDYKILAAAVPEPTSWAMLLGGLGVVLHLGVRRRKSR